VVNVIKNVFFCHNLDHYCHTQGQNLKEIHQ
jgi:hypothetical protein